MKITIHRALVRIKTTQERIKDLLDDLDLRRNEARLIDIYSNSNKKCKYSGLGVENTEKGLVASFDKFNSLCDELTALKRAVTVANSGIKKEAMNEDNMNLVTVCGEKYTVAEIIALRSSVIVYKQSMLSLMKEQLRKAINTAEQMNEKVEKELNNHISSMLGNDSKKNNDNLEAFMNMYMEKNSVKLVDPLHLQAQIDKLEKYLDGFENEADASLSESNALTMIEV